jgi:hypothetical protein
MAHGRVCFSVARIPKAHGASAAAGIASRSIASAELTSLKGHVMFLNGAYLGVPLLAVMGITVVRNWPHDRDVTRLGCNLLLNSQLAISN